MTKQPPGDGALASTVPLDSDAAITRRERDDEAWSDDTAVEAPGQSDLAIEGPDRYTLERELGSGGMGAVRLHLDRRIGRRIAIKTLHPELAASQHARARFLREACVQGQLEHPAVVPVYDVGVEPSGALYFSMKRVRGVTLEEILARRRAGEALDEERFGTRRLLAAFASVCLAVDFAHRRGVLHRDLKPANVMLGDFGEVYVLDWGLARLSEREISAGADRVSVMAPESTATQAGSLLGTPGYMSPEQARGDHGSVGPTTDVYALGAILFELLTGEPLHARGTNVQTILLSTLTGVDARPSRRAPHAQVAPELEEICLKATALAQSERYDNVRRLEQAVTRYLDGERDVERRRELAQQHVRAAHELAAKARGETTTVDARREAMREIGRALALAPDSAEAMRALVDLLTSPPTGMPPEVRLEMEDSARRRVRWVGRMGLVGYVSSFIYLPFLAWAGIRSPGAVLAFYACMAGCAALSAWAAWSRHPSSRVVLASMFLSNLALTSTAAFFGPLILTPPAIVANTTAYAVHLEGRDRVMAIVTGSLASLAAIGLWIAGLLPGGYTFGPEGMTILPGAISLPELPTITLLGTLGVGVVVLASIVVARLRDDLTAAERQVLLYAWHLRELIPTAARAPTDPTAARRARLD